MLGRLARGAYLAAIALMIAVYALSPAKSAPQPEPQPDQTIEYWYC